MSVRFSRGFTVSYGVSNADWSTMLAVIRSVSKRSLAKAAKVSTRSIPWDETAAGEMSHAELRRIFEVASVLAVEDRKQDASDKELATWLAEKVETYGLMAVAGSLGYDPANLAKVIVGKRALPKRVRKQVRKVSFYSPVVQAANFIKLGGR